MCVCILTLIIFIKKKTSSKYYSQNVQERARKQKDVMAEKEYIFKFIDTNMRIYCITAIATETEIERKVRKENKYFSVCMCVCVCCRYVY